MDIDQITQAEDEQLSAAFDEAVNEVNEETPTPAAEPVQEDAVESEHEEAPAPAAEQVQEESPAPTEEPDEDFLRRKQEIEERINQVRTPQQAAAQVSDELTEDEKQDIVTYELDWPETVKYVALQMKAARAEIRKELVQEFAQALQPLQANYAQTAAEKHYAGIVGAHPDYDNVYDGLVQWIGQQPRQLREAYTQIAAQGDTEDVVQMISQYKFANGLTTTEKHVVSSPQSRSVPAGTKQAVKSLAVVSSKRSVVPAVSDPNDFDSAWQEAIQN